MEPTPELYVEHLVQIFGAVRRVLRPDGTLWLNMGTSYISKTIESDNMVLRDDLTSDEVEYIYKELTQHANKS